MPAHTMSHFTVLTKDVAATEAFYTELLGLRTGYRPPISRPGVWLYAGEHPILHVIDPVNMPPQPAGVLDDMAFNATGLCRGGRQAQAARHQVCAVAARRNRHLADVLPRRQRRQGRTQL